MRAWMGDQRLLTDLGYWVFVKHFYLHLQLSIGPQVFINHIESAFHHPSCINLFQRNPDTAYIVARPRHCHVDWFVDQINDKNLSLHVADELLCSVYLKLFTELEIRVLWWCSVRPHLKGVEVEAEEGEHSTRV